MGPEPTLLFNPESNKEADTVIQVAEDANADLTHLNKGL